MSNNFKEDLEHLEAHLIVEYEIDVIFGRDEVDAYYYDDNAIGISTRHSKEIQLFCLLHEAGHHIYRTKSGNDSPRDLKISSKTISGKVDVVKEEILAWEEGLELATYLGIEINLNKWDRYSKKQIYDYVRWAVDSKRPT
jgi:hypothetical protein